MVTAKAPLQIANSRWAWVPQRSLTDCRPVRRTSRSLSISNFQAKHKDMNKTQTKVSAVPLQV